LVYAASPVAQRRFPRVATGTLALPMTSKAVVLVVDDDPGLRIALGDLLKSAGFPVRLFASAEELLAHPMPTGPHCLVLDVHLPGPSGLDLQAHLAQQKTGTPIVFITGHGDIPTSVRAMKAGAVEFLTKPFGEADLLNAVAGAVERSAAVHEDADDLRSIRERYQKLTHRQKEVMLLVTEGMLNKEAAGVLGTTEIMVKVHRRNVMAKMAAKSLPDLVRMADRLDLRRSSG
jgi:FixJ family two-component response regulator